MTEAEELKKNIETNKEVECTEKKGKGKQQRKEVNSRKACE